jgi:spore coat polysaccharide biosynthesis protein SpsF
MRTVCIIQARLRSTRLPGKILLPLPTEQTVLEEVVSRCWQIPSVDVVVVAMPDSPESQILAPFVENARTFYGSEHDVLSRYYGAAVEAQAEIIVRVTSDCPMIDPALCEQVIQFRAAHGLAYAYNNQPTLDRARGTFPQGLDCEVFTFKALEWFAQNARDAETREHVTTGLRKLGVGAVTMSNPAGDYGELRWTLDTIDDYVRICELMAPRLSPLYTQNTNTLGILMESFRQ